MQGARLIFGGFALVLTALCAKSEGLARKVDPLLGVGYHGHCVPGPCLPNASAYPSPDTQWPSPSKYPFPNPSGYWTNDPVVGFSQLHISGTGGTPTFGNFLVSPRLGGGFREADQASRFEIARAFCFAMRGRLTRWQTDCGIAPSAHGALYTFDFPATNDARLVFNVTHKIGNEQAMTQGEITLNPETGEIYGGGTFDKNWNPAPYTLYFYAKVDAAPKGVGTWKGGKVAAGSRHAALEKRDLLGGWLAFDTSARRRMSLKIAVSFKSVGQAKKWLEAEIPAWDFDGLAAAAEKTWDDALKLIALEGVDPLVERGIYSQFFHTMLQPHNRTGDEPGWGEKEPFWDDHYTIWDTWRTLFPLMSITRPEMYADVVNSFAARQRRHGECSVGLSQGKEYHVGQAGDDVDNVIADAYAKKLPGVDWNGVWEVLAAHAAKRTPEYLAKGYVPFGVKTDYCYRMKSASGTIGFAVNDGFAAMVAEGMGKKDVAEKLRRRSGNWTNVWDAALKDGQSGFTGFCRGRNPDGSFTKTLPREGFQTGHYYGDFYEGSCWEYSFTIFHDVPGMIAKMGGEKRFTERLEYAFENNLIDFGNEPSFRTIWLFDIVGRPDLASRWADVYRQRFLPMTMPGDDDSGAMGAMYLFLTAGFFPFAGSDVYALHGTAVPKMVFSIGKTGKTFTVIGRNTGPKNIYMQAVELNGKRLEKPFIRQADIVAGGTLVFTMGSEAKKEW